MKKSWQKDRSGGLLVPSSLDCNEVTNLSSQNMKLKSDLESTHAELASTRLRLKDLESILLVKSESRRIEEEILKITSENSYLRSMNAELSEKIALQQNYASYNCSSDLNKDAEFRKADVTNMNKTEIVQSPVFIGDKNDLKIEAYETLKPRGHTEEESFLSELSSSELGSADTVSALINQMTNGSTAVGMCKSLKHDDASGKKDVTPCMPSLISHWLPLFSDSDSNIGNLLYIVSLRSHYVRLPNPGEVFTSLEHVEQKFRELLRRKRRGQDCRQS